MLPAPMRLADLALAAQLGPAPTPEARRAVGEISAVLLAVALTILVAFCALLLIYLRKRARIRAELSAPRRRFGAGPDAWAEAAKRVPLEDDNAIPREPGTG